MVGIWTKAKKRIQGIWLCYLALQGAVNDQLFLTWNDVALPIFLTLQLDTCSNLSNDLLYWYTWKMTKYKRRSPVFYILFLNGFWREEVFTIKLVVLLVFLELYLFDKYECTNANTYYYYKSVYNYQTIKATCTSWSRSPCYINLNIQFVVRCCCWFCWYWRNILLTIIVVYISN